MSRRVKIFGAGSIGNHLANASRHLGWSVTVCDVSEDALLRMRAETYPGRYGRWDEAIQLLTNRDAPRNRVIAMDVNQPEQENWQEIIAEDEAVLRSASLVGGHFFAQYMVDVKSAVKIFEMDGTPEGEVALPGLGSAFGFDGGAASPITLTSFIHAGCMQANLKQEVSLFHDLNMLFPHCSRIN